MIPTIRSLVSTLLVLLCWPLVPGKLVLRLALSVEPFPHTIQTVGRVDGIGELVKIGGRHVGKVGEGAIKVLIARGVGVYSCRVGGIDRRTGGRGTHGEKGHRNGIVDGSNIIIRVLRGMCE